jgi:hypothetical protein
MDVMTLAEVFDRSIEILKKHIKTIVLFTLVYGVLLIAGVIFFLIAGTILSVVSGAMLQSGAAAIAVIVILGVVLASLALTHYIGIIKISSQEFSGEEVLTDKAVKASFKSLLKIFGIILCLLIMFIPVGVLFYLLSKVFFGSFDSLIYGIDVVTGRGIGVIILLILFIFALGFIFFSYSTWIAFAFQSMLIENKGIFASIKRSFTLVRKSFWRVFGSLLLIMVIVYALQLSLGGFAALVSSIFYLVTKFLNINQDMMSFFTIVAQYISLPLNLISWLIIMPIGYIMTTMLYYNERFKKEGYDISIRLKELQKNQERKQVSEFNS